MKAYWMHDAKNWGDAFTPFLFKEGFQLDVEWAGRAEADVFACGSLLERVHDGFAGHILGSGMGYHMTRRNLRSVKSPLLLRGRLTADRCEYDQPVRLGDPGILANMFLAGDVTKLHRYGLVPHYVDRNVEDVLEWERRGIFIIDIESGIVPVINAIASCENIISSCLHGLVIADSLCIPSRHVRLSKWVLGDNFKFHDYYSAYGEALVTAPSIAEAMLVCRARDATLRQVVYKDVFSAFTEYAEGLREVSSDV